MFNTQYFYRTWILGYRTRDLFILRSYYQTYLWIVDLNLDGSVNSASITYKFHYSNLLTSMSRSYWEI